MPVRIMSDAELTKFEIIRDIDHERLPVSAAARILGLSERHVWRLLHAYRAIGADGLISKKRGRPSNRRTPAEVRQAAMAIVRERYADFGPTLAAEKLRELHDLGAHPLPVPHPAIRQGAVYPGAVGGRPDCDRQAGYRGGLPRRPHRHPL